MAQGSPYRRVVPPPPGRCPGQQAIAAQRVEQLYRLIRIAVCARLDRLGQARGRRPVNTQDFGDHGDQVRARQVGQRQALHRGLIEPAG